MNRNQQNQDYGRDRNQGRRSDEDQYRGAYRQDDYRGGEYDRLNRRNDFNDNDIRNDYRSRDYYGSDQDRRANFSSNSPDYGRDRDRQGERFDNPNVFPSESNNGLRSAARNHGNMGSFGGAQGWGSSRNGSHQGSSDGSQWASGHGRDDRQQVNRQVYGAYRDHNSFAEGEREQYDGSGRYGTQGSDSTRGWEPADRAGSNGAVYSFGTNDVSRRGDDSQYEIYDNTQSQYNRGQYGNNMGGDSYMGSLYDRNGATGNSGIGNWNEPRRQHYDQQNEGMHSENYGNEAGSLSWGNDRDYRTEEGRNRRYDPMSGHVRNQGSTPPSREDFSW
ncbi:hypothetical protein [Rufibacter roseus]|uniref:SWFGD domain-containing protein n=1 Tax=Rufibacter roseus TaxID=1567108 RepID=A0ABW2DQI5_9BACT|nr:hypothetical protein [Rufibacter roseus]